jgi:hypothetical protein
LEKEHQQVIHHQVWETIPKSNVDAKVKILSMAWTMKQKADGVFCACLIARDYEQIKKVY